MSLLRLPLKDTDEQRHPGSSAEVDYKQHNFINAMPEDEVREEGQDTPAAEEAEETETSSEVEETEESSDESAEGSEDEGEEEAQ